MNRTLSSLFSACVVALGVSNVAAETIYVSSDLTTGLNDGSTWSNALQGSAGLQLALSMALPGDQVFAAGGTYYADPSNQNVSFQLRDGVKVYGSFVGFELSPDQRPDSAAFGFSASILQGDLNGDDAAGIVSDNTRTLVLAEGVQTDVLLDGFTVTAGQASGVANSLVGGGFNCLGGACLSVVGCHLLGNHSDAFGGAGVVYESSAGFSNCLFEDNTSDFQAGGVWATDSSSVHFEGCQFLNNSALAFGGAVRLKETPGEFTDCVFMNNECDFQGGAIFMTGASPTNMDRCHFIDNRGNPGGAVSVSGVVGVVMSNCLFTGNLSSDLGGGAISVSGPSFMILISSTVSRNRVEPSTVITPLEGGILVSDGATVLVDNSILWGNQGPDGAQAADNQITPGNLLSYSIVQGGSAGIGNLSLDPSFVDAANADFRLNPNSPAIDAGNNNLIPPGVVHDLDLSRRFSDDPLVPDTGVGTAPLVDIGAYEASSEPFVKSYCTPKLSSAGCATNITTNSLEGPISGVGDFYVQADAVQGSKNGLLFAGFAASVNLPFAGGVLCSLPPLKRGPIQASFGSSANACDGVFSTLVNDGAIAPLGLDAGAGNTAWYQYWYRDVANGAGNLGTALSNAVEVDYR